jgi:hypothetical protein
METLILRVVCAWCRLVLRDGSANAPTSHGMCPTCSARLLQEVA